MLKKPHTYISDTWELIMGKIKDMQKQPACVKYSCPPCLPAFPGYYHPGYSWYGAIWVAVMSNGDPSGQNHSFGHLSAKCPFPPSNSSWSRNSDWTLSHLILCLSLMCIKRINLQEWFYFWRVFWFGFFFLLISMPKSLGVVSGLFS